MEIAKSEGKYSIDEMQQMATIASTADGLSIKGNNFKVCALTGSPDMLLFACERIKELEQELTQTQIVATEIQDLMSGVSEFVENLDCVPHIDESKAFNACLAIGNKIRDLDLPEFTDV